MPAGSTSIWALAVGKWRASACVGLLGALVTGPLLVVATITGAQPAAAEPLTPLSAAELQYLEQLRRVFAVSHDPIAFRSDGELLNRGRNVCRQRDSGLVGQEATLQTPAISQLAFLYLCPR